MDATVAGSCVTVAGVGVSWSELGAVKSWAASPAFKQKKSKRGRQTELKRRIDPFEIER
jgi:hypothetical protein